MASVQVLCPNAHRLTVKVNPNTKIIQILEEVCTKKGFLPPEEYALRQGKRVIDLSQPFRYSGLLNHAHLELFKTEEVRTETSVGIALQLDNGNRLQHDFLPSVTSLWQILQHFETVEEGSNLTAEVEGKHPVMIYMREEVIGEYALKETSLKALGLTQGKAILRFIHRAVDDNVLKDIKAKIAKEKARLAKIASMMKSQSSELMDAETNKSSEEGMDCEDKKVSKESMDCGEKIASNESMDCASKNTSKESMDCVEKKASKDSMDCGEKKASKESMDCVEKKASKESMDCEEKKASKESMDCEEKKASKESMDCEEKKASKESMECEEKRASEESMDISAEAQPSSSAGMRKRDEDQEKARRLAQVLMPGLLPAPKKSIVAKNQSQPRPKSAHLQQPAPQPSFANFKFPEATKGQDLYRNELSKVNREEYQACERDPVLFSLDQINRRSVSEEIPDTFFEVTESDVKKMWADLQKKVKLQEEQMLMSSSLRKLNEQQKFDKYERAIIRFHFPDQHVIQAMFRPRETVFALKKFLRNHLHEEVKKTFYLYTTPPRVLLNEDAKTLIEAHLVPMSFVYVGFQNQPQNFLASDILSQKANLELAENAVMEHMAGISESAIASTSQDHQSKRSAESQRSSGSSNSEKKVPKWFKIGNK